MMNWLKNRWLRYTHRHRYQVVETAQYVHFNRFTGTHERFPAAWLRCTCGHEKAEAVVVSFSVTTHIPIDRKKWRQVTVDAQSVEPVTAPVKIVERMAETPNPVATVVPPGLVVGAVMKTA
jgi:hypothetical protein